MSTAAEPGVAVPRGITPEEVVAAYRAKGAFGSCPKRFTPGDAAR